MSRCRLKIADNFGGGLMRFQLLGPLDIVYQGRSLALSGTKQRATIAYLLLHLNGVVATSQLLKALWPDDMPNTGRKMLQNAVSGIRGILSEVADDPNSPMLLTHAPGYLLRVDPEAVDLSRFRELVGIGRADLAAGSWQQASSTLREALALWRGPVLADLVEQGITWPELTSVHHSRLAALEDCVEAQFASGHYGEVINELEAWIATEPLRERLCGQLMRALYYCGRQADALGVYRHTRARLIDEHGLDPSRELQDLERAILTQELPSSVPGRGIAVGTRTENAQVEDTWPSIVDNTVDDSRADNTVESSTIGSATGEWSGALEQPSVGDAPRWPEPVVPELKRVTAVLVMTRFDRDIGEFAPEDVDVVLRRIASDIQEEVERAGGVVQGRLASLWLATFGSVRNREDDAARSVRVAMAVRDRLAAPDAPSLERATLTVTVAVATGDALVRPPDGEQDVPSVTGGVLDRSMRLLAHVSPGEVWVCSETRAATEPVIGYDGGHDPVRGSRAVAGRAHRADTQPSAPFVNRHGELDMLFGALEQVRRRSRPHLVTVLGEVGIGKSRLVTEFERAVAGGPVPTRCLVGHSLRFGRRGPFPALVESLRPCFGIVDSDSAELAAEKLGDGVRRMVGGTRAAWMLPHLRVLFGVEDDRDGREVSHESFMAWRQLLEELCAAGPLILIIEDLHCANDLLLDFVDQVTAEAGSFPLLVIVTARPELLDRRPSWGGGKAGANTITLAPLSDADTTAMLTLLCAKKNVPVCARADSLNGGFPEFQAVIPHIGGNPLLTVEYARMLREKGAEWPRWLHSDESGAGGSTPGLLPLARRVVASMIDSLPPDSKSVLLDAAVLGENICAAGVSAVGGGPMTVVGRGLEYLERRELLRRSGRSGTYAEYTFRSSLVGDVAYLTIPRSVLVDRHRRAAEWLERAPVRDSRLLAFHRERVAGMDRAPAPVHSATPTHPRGPNRVAPFSGGGGELQEPRRCSVLETNRLGSVQV
jgi:DNA-binding SARP family transcriptional activator